jgi:uncharacterized membrane protein
MILLTSNLAGLFVTQSVIFWTVGIKLFMHFHRHQGLSSPLAKLAVFVISTIATLVSGEVYFRFIDMPSQWLAQHLHLWLLH